MSSVDEEMVIGTPGYPEYEKPRPVQSVEEVAHIRTSGKDGKRVHLGDTVFSKDDLVNVFRDVFKPELGEVQPTGHLGETQPTAERFAAPAPMGLCAFALCTFVVSLVNIAARHMKNTSIMIAIAFFYGGAVQFLAAAWSIACGDAFGAIAFSSYGAYWLSYGAIVSDSFGIVSNFNGDSAELASAMGFFYIAWFVFTFFMFLFTIRTNIGNMLLYAGLDLIYLLLACAEFTGKEALTKASGWVGLCVAFIAWYNAFSDIALKQLTFVTLPKKVSPLAPEEFREKTE